MSAFSERHIGSNVAEKQAMLTKIGVSSIEELINKTIPIIFWGFISQKPYLT